MKKIVWLLMMVVMPMLANAAFSHNADLEDEDELLHRVWTNILLVGTSSLPRKRRNSYE